MTLLELQHQVLALSSAERRHFCDALLKSLQPKTSTKQECVVNGVIGIAKTAETTPNDEVVQAMLNEH